MDNNTEEKIENEEIVKDYSTYMSIFNEVLDEVGLETDNYNYDKALLLPKLLKIILSKKSGREALKEMILYSQQPGYEMVWPRAKAYKLASFLNEKSLEPGYAKDKLKNDEFIDALNLFEIAKKQEKQFEEYKEKQKGREKVKKY